MKSLRKLVQQYFKKYTNFTDEECALKFFELVSSLKKFNQEYFKVGYGVNMFDISSKIYHYTLKRVE